MVSNLYCKHSPTCLGLVGRTLSIFLMYCNFFFFAGFFDSSNYLKVTHCNCKIFSIPGKLDLHQWTYGVLNSSLSNEALPNDLRPTSLYSYNFSTIVLGCYELLAIVQQWSPANHAMIPIVENRGGLNCLKLKLFG